MIEENKAKYFFRKHQDILVPIIIAVGVLLLAIILFLISNNLNDVASNSEPKIKAITAKGIIKNEEFKGLEFTNATLLKENDVYTLSVDVKNTSKEKSKIIAVDIPIKDKEGNDIITLLGYIGKELEQNESVTVTASTSADLSKAYTKTIAERK